MKHRFSTIDIKVSVRELDRFLGMRVYNVYDVDNKTYLIRLSKPDTKAVILIESGIRIHSTEFDWPKHPAPSGFSMKLRKHIKGRRLERVQQLGLDRIVDLTFGSGEAAYHIVLELYDKGNIILTDYQYKILNILRPRKDGSLDVRFAVNETYPVSAAKQHVVPDTEWLQGVLLPTKEGDMLKKILVSNLDYGPAILEHCLLGAGFPENVKINKGFSKENDTQRLMTAVNEAEQMLENMEETHCKGYIIQKKEKRPSVNPDQPSDLLTYEEFHPFLLRQHERKPYVEFESFDNAVDEFFSKLESQKFDTKAVQQEKTAIKKLENVKNDHEKRVHGLQLAQETDIMKGQLIEMNLTLVDNAIKIVRSAVANQIDWTEIGNLVKEAQTQGDEVASALKTIRLETNHITMLLQYPSVAGDRDSDDDDFRTMLVDLDLSLSAYANSRKYFEKKRSAAKKEQKTIDASAKALKSAERKTKQTLKDVATAAVINKTRKTYWFEKFLWFISSNNELKMFALYKLNLHASSK